MDRMKLAVLRAHDRIAELEAELVKLNEDYMVALSAVADRDDAYVKLRSECDALREVLEDGIEAGELAAEWGAGFPLQGHEGDTSPHDRAAAKTVYDACSNFVTDARALFEKEEQ